MATSAGWDGTLDAIFDNTDCKQQDTEIGNYKVLTFWTNIVLDIFSQGLFDIFVVIYPVFKLNSEIGKLFFYELMFSFLNYFRND